MYPMKNIIFCIIFSSFHFSFSQSKSEILGRWEIVKVDIGEVWVDKNNQFVSKPYCDRFIGKKDSALAINLMMGAIKNMIGMEYNFKNETELTEYNPNSRQMKNGKYSYINNIIKATINSIIEEYKIISLDKESMVLEIGVNNSDKAKVYLTKRS